MSQNQSVAFFGATGGCALGALARTIEAGIPCSALVRSESKLLGLLKERKLSDTQIEKSCTIVQGDVKDVDAVQKAILAANSSAPNEPANLIISGIGGTPKPQVSVTTPLNLTDPTICQNAATSIVAALRKIQQAGAQTKPLVAVVTTIAIEKANDVPFGYGWFYAWVLKVAVKDKIQMEHILGEQQRKASAPDAALRGVVFVRPTVLGDAAADLDKLRVGWNYSQEYNGAKNVMAPGPARGYNVSRETVGAWMHKELVAGARPDEWAGRSVTLTG